MARSKNKRKSRKTRAPSQHAVVTLAIDIGGTGLKATVLDSKGSMLADRVRVDTPYPASPEIILDALVELVGPLPPFDRISIGFPGVVRDGHVLTAPHFGNEEWHKFPLADRLADQLGKPARMLNDAEVQGYGAILGSGLEFVITLGTGVGTALFRDGELMPHMEFAQYPIRRQKTFNEYLGNDALRDIGGKKWSRRVSTTIDAFRTLLNFDTLYIGGGNARKLEIDLPRDVQIVSNKTGLTGGIRLWGAAPPAAGGALRNR